MTNDGRRSMKDDWRDAQVLVTGATGFIGAHLVRRLVEQGAQVSALCVEDSATLQRLSSLRKVNIDWHQVDLRTFGAVSRAVKAIQPDVVFHLAAQGVTEPFLSPDAAIRANVYGTIHLLRAVDGKAPVIVARTPGERDALNVYAASKAAAWTFCAMYRRTHGWPIIGALLFQVYGPGQSMKTLIPAAIAAALRGDDFPMTHGKQQRDWVYVADVVEALVSLTVARSSASPDAEPRRTLHERLATAGAAQGDVFPDTIEVGTGKTASVREVVESIYRIAGGSGKPLVGALPARPGEVQHQAADAHRTEQLIGWRARTTLDDGLRKTIEWTRERLIQPAN